MHLGRGSNKLNSDRFIDFLFFPPSRHELEEEGEGLTSVWLNRDEAKVSVDRLGK